MDVLQLKANIVKLPSLGMSYESISLLEDSCVEVRNFLLGDKRELEGVMGAGNVYDIYKTLLQRLVTAPKNMVFEELLLSDVLAIMYEVKMRSFGPEYLVSYDCFKCGQGNRQIFQLTELMVKYADEFENYKATGIQVKIGDHELTCHLPTLKDEKEVVKHLNQMQRMNRIKNRDSDTEYIRLVQQVDSIDGKELSFPERFKLMMDTFPFNTQELLNKALSENDTGVDLNQAVANCSCGATNYVPLTITSDFFRSPSDGQESS